MRSLRMLSSLLNAVCVVCLGLVIVTAESPAMAQTGISYCTTCPLSLPCGGPGYCGFFAGCATCTCLPDPIGPGNACL